MSTRSLTFLVAYFGLGLAQVAAILGAFVNGFGIPTFLAIPLAVLVAFIPVVGSGLGIYGATIAWQWPWWLGVLLFFWHVPLLVCTVAFRGIVSPKNIGGAALKTDHSVGHTEPPDEGVNSLVVEKFYLDVPEFLDFASRILGKPSSEAIELINCHYPSTAGYVNHAAGPFSPSSLVRVRSSADFTPPGHVEILSSRGFRLGVHFLKKPDGESVVDCTNLWLRRNRSMECATIAIYGTAPLSGAEVQRFEIEFWQQERAISLERELVRKLQDGYGLVLSRASLAGC